MSAVRKLLFVSFAGVLAGCDAGRNLGVDPQRPILLAALEPGTGTAGVERFELCKVGSSGSFSYTIDRAANGAGVDESGTVDLAEGECVIVARGDALGATVTVTETGSQSGFVLDHVAITRLTAVACANPQTVTSTASGPTVSGTLSGSMGDGVCDGTLVVFHNVPEQDQFLPGRMTGGGHQIIIGNVKITRGFTIHCDIVLSNNIEVNWPGNKWHLDKPITSATCLDDPTVSPVPPDAPFDTFIGEGIGRLNGVDGSRIRFVFQDGGEPGRRSNDRAQIQIWDANNNLVLDVPFQFLSGGNIQAHYDQPHK